MNFTNKLTALILALCLFAVPTAFAASNTVADDDYGKNAYDFLMAVGALDANENAYAPSMEVSRAHFVKLALHLSNDAPKVLVSNDEVFSDVTPSTEYEAYIETAFRLNYIAGASGSAFNPGDIITLPQALKILVNILGYGHVAELGGGYPAGYYSVAQSLDLTDGLGADTAAGLNLSDAMILLYNAANADIMEMVSYGEDVNFEAKDGRTLLTERHKIENVEGIINANAYTEIYAQNSELDKNQIKLDDVVYSDESGKLSDLIGLKVTLYYKADENKFVKDAVYAEVSEDNLIVEANPEDIESDGKTLTLYDESDNSKNYKLSTGVSYIVNKKMAAMTPSDIPGITCGSVKLISNDGDKSADVIVITKYDNLVVAGVDITANLIAAKDGSIIAIDPESDEYSFELQKDGNPATVADILVGESILVSSSEGNGYGHVTVLASSEKVSGAFSEIGDDYVVIGGKTYKTNSLSASDIALGKTYTVLIDAFGNACYVENVNDVVYGFLYAVAKEGMDSPKCRIFTENNRWVDLYFADKVKYTDSDTYPEAKLTSEEVYAKLVSLGDDLKQIIRYTVNADAEVVTLDLASDNYQLGTEGASEAAENNVFRHSLTERLNYRSVGSFNGKFYIDAGTKIFNIPSDYDKSKFAVKSSSIFTNDQPYTVSAYDVDDMLSAKVLVVSNVDSDTVYHTDRFMIVTGKGMKFNSDEEAVPSIIGFRNSKEISIPVTVGDDGVSADIYNSIKEGDLIITKFDDKGNISYLQTYDLNTKFCLSPAIWNLCTIIGGEVIKTDTSLKRIRVTYNEAGDETAFIYAASTTVQMWDKSDKTLTNASPASILPGDRIYAKMRYLNSNEIIIVRD